MAEELRSLGRNLHIILFDKKMSKSNLAKKVGISQQMMSEIINGNKAPGAATLVKMAKALGVTVDELIKEK